MPPALLPPPWVLSKLRELGIPTDASILERMTVADARCHKVVYKIVAYGKETERRRLHGHTIVRALGHSKLPLVNE